MRVETIYKGREKQGLGKGGDLPGNFVKSIVQNGKTQERPALYGSQWFTTAGRFENINIFALFFPALVNITVWTMACAIPYHSLLLFENFGVGLHIISLQTE